MNREIERVHVENGLVNKEVKYKKIKQPYTPPHLFKLHTLAAFVGHRGSGKTHAMVNLTKAYLDEGSFNRIFIISPTYESNPIFHVLDIHHEDVYTNHQQANTAVSEILLKTKDDSDAYDNYEEYMDIFKKWKNKGELSTHERTMLENNSFKKPPKVPRPSPLLIIDDMSHSDIYSVSRNNPFINLCLRHRHINHGKGISIFMAVQTFKSGIPLPLRQNVQQYFIWFTHDSGQLEAIYKEVANLIDEETFMELYRESTKSPHDFLTIDTNAPPLKQFRHNFDTILSTKPHK